MDTDAIRKEIEEYDKDQRANRELRIQEIQILISCNLVDSLIAVSKELRDVQAQLRNMR